MTAATWTPRADIQLLGYDGLTFVGDPGALLVREMA
jgi:hypothetical protein